MTNKEKRPKLSVANFLKLVPERLKRILGTPDRELPPLASYKPNELALALHPGTQYARVGEVRELCDGVNLYTLLPDPERGTQALAPFKAGQYVSLTVRIGNNTFSRPYSICSAPSEAATKYEIAVKRVPGGTVSGFIHDTFAPGTEVTLSEPDGQFTYEPLRDAGTVIGCAGGVGITPFRSLIRAILCGDEAFELTLLYGCREPSAALFRDEFEALNDPRIRIVYVYSDAIPAEGERTPNDAEGGRASFERGFIGAELIRKYVPAGQYSVFVCGPQAMYAHMRREFAKLGLRRKFLREDAYGQITEPRTEADYAAPERDKYTVTVLAGTESVRLECGADETLLSALERGSVAAPSHCRSGECGFCHSRLVSGTCYTPADRDRRRAADKVYSYIHPCCAFPRSDIELELSVQGGSRPLTD